MAHHQLILYQQHQEQLRLGNSNIQNPSKLIHQSLGPQSRHSPQNAVSYSIDRQNYMVAPDHVPKTLLSIDAEHHGIQGGKKIAQQNHGYDEKPPKSK